MLTENEWYEVVDTGYHWRILRICDETIDAVDRHGNRATHCRLMWEHQPDNADSGMRLVSSPRPRRQAVTMDDYEGKEQHE